MKILGIESSGMVGSVAVVEDGVTKAEYTINNKKTHSQTLLPMLDDISKMLGEDLSDVDAIAVSEGPGSFTGLRIGSASVKGLAQAWNKPIVAIPTVDGLAFNLWGHGKMVCPLMDARRNQTYTGLYEFTGSECKMNTILKQCAVALDEILDKVNEIGRPVTFLGDGVPVFKEQIADKCKVEYDFAPAFANRQRAAVIATLAEDYFKAGKTQTATEHAPEYLRLSQAERERMEQSNADS